MLVFKGKKVQKGNEVNQIKQNANNMNKSET